MCARGCTLEHYVTESIIASPECTTIKTRWLAKCVIKVFIAHQEAENQVFRVEKAS